MANWIGMGDSSSESETLCNGTPGFTFLSVFSEIKMRRVTTSLGWDKVQMNIKPFEAKKSL